MISAVNMGARPYPDAKTESDDLHKIEVFWLKRNGYLRNGRLRKILWKNTLDETIFETGIKPVITKEKNVITISYWQNGRFIEYDISLSTTRCYFGGKRFWFYCLCGRRVGVLYKGGDYFRCRHCYDLTYKSRNENRRKFYFGIFQIIRLSEKMKEMQKGIKRRFYAGKPTRKQRRIDKLNREIGRFA